MIWEALFFLYPYTKAKRLVGKQLFSGQRLKQALIDLPKNNLF